MRSRPREIHAAHGWQATLDRGASGGADKRAAGARGGGPENLFLVVNSASWSSQAVANHYIELRQIPPLNVLYLNWNGGFDMIEADVLRQKILGPAVEIIKRRGLVNHIDYIIYSSDFPYAIDMTKDFAGTGLPDQARGVCSISSCTYLAHFLLAKNVTMMDFHVNRYMRTAHDRAVDEPSHGFHSWYGWGTGGELIEAGGQPYLLSTMLAMTSGRGNSVREALDYLRRSATADGTHPKGTIYFSKTANVRSTARADQIDVAVAELKELGVASQVIATDLPVAHDDVQGLMTGTPDFSWARSGSKILPGAICENFTSFGGILIEKAGQTPLNRISALRRRGLQRHGRRAVCNERQIPLAVGARALRARLHAGRVVLSVDLRAGADADRRRSALSALGRHPESASRRAAGRPAHSGQVTLKPKAQSPGGAKIARFILYVDGRLSGAAGPAENLEWDTTKEPDGYHEVRVVAVESSPIQTQGRAILGVTVDNHQRSVKIATLPAKTVRWGENLRVRAAAPGMSEIYIVSNSRVLGKISGASGEVQIDPRILGTGPVMLQATGSAGEVLGAAPDQRVWSPPVRLTIEPSPPLPPLANPPANLRRGLALKLADGKVVPVQDTSESAWLTLAGVRAEQPYVLQGFFDVPDEDVYQFQVFHSGDAKLSIDGHTVYDGQQGDNTQKFVPINLAAGLHRLTVSGKAGGDMKLRILFGGPGAYALGGRSFRHAR